MRILLLVLISLTWSTLLRAQSEPSVLHRFVSEPARSAPIEVSSEKAKDTTIDSQVRIELRSEIDRGIKLFASFNLEEAATAFDRATLINPTSFFAFYNLGVTYLEMQKYERAVPALMKALALSPNSAMAWHHLGYAYDRLNQVGKAVDCYRNALNRDATIVAAHNNLGFDYLMLKRYTDAETSFRRALALNSNHQGSIEGMCLISSIAENTEDSVGFCERASAANANKWVLKYLLGLAYCDAGRFDDAIRLFTEVLKVEPKHARVYVAMGHAHRKKKQLSKAIDFFDRAISLSPDLAEAHAGLGSGLFETQKYRQAKEKFYRALALYPEDPVSHYNLALTCLALKQRDCALEQYSILKDLNPEFAKQLFNQIYSNRILNVAR